MVYEPIEKIVAQIGPTVDFSMRIKPVYDFMAVE